MKQMSDGHLTSLFTARNIEKSFPGARVLKGMDLDILKGEIHGLIGVNGAGKSTLVNIIAGHKVPDNGALTINGKEVQFSRPLHAIASGVGVAYQEDHLIPRFTVWQNLILGIEGKKGARAELRARAMGLLEEFGASFRFDTPISALTLADRRIVQLVRLFMIGNTMAILDEPTEVLPPKDVDRLFAVLRARRSEGVGIVYISHRLDEVLQIADRVSVLRDGKRVDTVHAGKATREQLISLMIGEPLSSDTVRNRSLTCPNKEPIIEAQMLNDEHHFFDVNLKVFPGEIVGLVGIPGSGRTELLEALFGARQIKRGSIKLAGEAVHLRSPKNAIRNGVFFVPADRKRLGLVLSQSVRVNTVMARLPTAKFGLRQKTKEREIAAKYCTQLDVRPSDTEMLTRYLSGGNQQKVLFARALHREAQLFLIDEPTQGVDVSGKRDIYGLIRELTGEGKSVLFSSSDVDELLLLADRICIMRAGRLVAERPAHEANREWVLGMALTDSNEQN